MRFSYTTPYANRSTPCDGPPPHLGGELVHDLVALALPIVARVDHLAQLERVRPRVERLLVRVDDVQVDHQERLPRTPHASLQVGHHVVEHPLLEAHDDVDVDLAVLPPLRRGFDRHVALQHVLQSVSRVELLVLGHELVVDVLVRHAAELEDVGVIAARARELDPVPRAVGLDVQTGVEGHLVRLHAAVHVRRAHHREPLRLGHDRRRMGTSIGGCAFERCPRVESRDRRLVRDGAARARAACAGVFGRSGHDPALATLRERGGAAATVKQLGPGAHNHQLNQPHDAHPSLVLTFECLGARTRPRRGRHTHPVATPQEASSRDPRTNAPPESNPIQTRRRPPRSSRDAPDRLALRRTRRT